jgi:hypothetical protein
MPTWVLVVGAIIVVVAVFWLAFIVCRDREHPPWWL